MDLQIEDKNIIYHKNKNKIKIKNTLMEDLEKELHEELNNQEENILDIKEALKLDYDLNYIVSDLKLIASYYNLSTRKLRKSEIIDIICDYELNEENCFFVEKRKLQWFYMHELENDPFFKKYLLIA